MREVLGLREGSGMTGLDNWIAMVAAHAARHVAAGKSDADAVRLGMADYTAQLEWLVSLSCDEHIHVTRRRSSKHAMLRSERHRIHADFVKLIAERVHTDANRVVVGK